MSIISWGFPNQQQVTDQQVGGLQQYKEVTITSAQLVNDIANGIELLPAPGVGIYNQIVQIIAEVSPAPTPPDLGGITNIYIYGTNYGNLLSFDPAILSTSVPMYSVGIGYALYSANGIMNAYDMWVSDGWGIRSDGGAIVSCNTYLKLKIWYVTRQFTA